MRLLRALLLIAGLMLVAGLYAPVNAATTGSGEATVVGTVVDQQNALPIKGARIQLVQNGKVVKTATADDFGTFSLSGVVPGVYEVDVVAKGYARSQTLNVTIANGAVVTVNAALIAAMNTSNVHTLGRVTVTGQALSSATAITQNVSVQNVVQTGQIRFTDQLEHLPALNVSTSSSPGDDVTVDIRGFGASETSVLLDDRPVGPFGVGAPDNYNFADSPVSALDGVDVAYGSGAQGLYGSDTIAGGVNMHLLNPTAKATYGFQQQVGGFGLASTAVSFSGTYDKLGYVAEAGIAGETGSLVGNIFQSGRPANVTVGSVNPPYLCSNGYTDPATGNTIAGIDISDCNQGAETYYVGQQHKVGTELAKLRYSFSGSTSLSVSAYNGVSWANSTGNGDNDFLPYGTRLGQVQLTSPNCVIGGGSTANGYTVVTSPSAWKNGGEPATAPGPGLACLTAQQFAQASWGPVGGGAGRQRSTNMQDYDARFTTKLGINNITVDSYVNNYWYWKDSSISQGLDASGGRLGTPVFADYYYTHGYLISDDLVTQNNDFTLGWALLNQLQYGNTLNGVGTLPNGQNILAFQPAYNTALYKVGNYFIRDSHQFGDRWYGVINAWFKGSNVTNKNTFDPRASVQYRPDSSDVLRLTYGRSDGIPAPLLKSTAPVFAPNPGTSLTSVTCIPGCHGVASGGNPNLISESANDYEFGYGHRFGADSDVQVNAYVTSVANELFGATQPLLDYGLSNVTFGAGTLDLYLSRLIAQGCLPAGSTITSVYPFLGVSTTYNAANELARGIELNGRQHLTPNLYLDYGWSVESSQQFNIPNSILSNNVTLINGTQQAGIPLHQANISVDLQQAGFEFRLDNYWVDANNPIDRPGYITSNFFITHPMENNRLLLSLGGTNIFNQAVQYYGLIGEGQPVAVNSFAPSAPFTGIGQNLAGISSNERYGLQPAQLVFTLTAKM